MYVVIGYRMEVIDPAVNVSNWNVGITSIVIRLAGVIKLENTSNWRFAVENVRFELFATAPVIGPF
jgi:hypothetical protein